MIETKTFGELDQFLQEHCEISADYRVTKREIYDFYCGWSLRQKKEPLSKNIFGRELKMRGFVEVRSKTTRYWAGVGLYGARNAEVPTSGIAPPLLSVGEAPRVENTLMEVDEIQAKISSVEVEPHKEQRRVHFPKNEALDSLLMRVMGR